MTSAYLLNTQTDYAQNTIIELYEKRELKTGSSFEERVGFFYSQGFGVEVAFFHSPDDAYDAKEALERYNAGFSAERATTSDNTKATLETAYPLPNLPHIDEFGRFTTKTDDGRNPIKLQKNIMLGPAELPKKNKKREKKNENNKN